MQSPSTIGDFPHTPPSAPSKRNYGLENQFETFLQQQQQQAVKVNNNNNNNTQPSTNATATTTATTTTTDNRNTTQRPGVATSFLYKLTEIAAYTSAVATEAYHTLTVGAKAEQESPKDGASRRSQRGYSQYFDEDVMQIGDNSDDSDINDGEIADRGINQSNGEMNRGEMDNKLDGKGQCSWATNEDDDEPPPPYDSSWSMPTPSAPKNSTLGLQDSTAVKSPSRQIHFAGESTQQESSPIDISSTTPPTSTKRRQIRVRRPRRPLRRKSSSNDISAQRGGYDDQDQMLLKVNEKLADMITQGRAALRSTVNITEVEMMLAEEKDRDARIMKELGLQTPNNRRRRNTGSSSDYDYFGGSLSDSGSHSAPESSYCDYGYGPGSGYESPNFKHTSPVHYNTPTQYGSPGVFGQSVGYNSAIHNEHSMLGSGKYVDTSMGGVHGEITGNYSGYNGPSPGRFGSVPPPNRYGGSIPPGAYGNPSGNFGSNNGQYGSNCGGYPKQNVGSYTGSNSGYPGANGYGQNVGLGSNGIHNNNREFLY